MFRVTVSSRFVALVTDEIARKRNDEKQLSAGGYPPPAMCADQAAAYLSMSR
jgi:hypothetical protein